MVAAQAAAATVIVDNLEKHHGVPGLTTPSLSNHQILVYGRTWSRNIINTVGSGRINSILSRRRNHPMPKAEYDRPATPPKQAYIESPDLPPELREWKLVSDLFRPDPPPRVGGGLFFRARLLVGR